MIAKRLKNLSKLGILIAARQGYFLGANIYQLYYSPFLTIKKIIDTRDKSQTFLILVAALTPVIFYIIGRVVWDLIMYGEMLPVTGSVFLIMGVIQTMVILYLGYWTVIVFKNK